VFVFQQVDGEWCCIIHQLSGNSFPVVPVTNCKHAAAPASIIRRDGTAPGDPVKSQLQQDVFTAGELSAFLAGQRGIALVQLFNGWDASKGQPIYNPLAIHMMEKALSAPGVAHISSVAPGGVGLTGILYADREPFASWATHLASFGCQANAVAGSAYYKLLIGQLLGYKLENVLGYVAASGEPASAQLQQQVGALSWQY
jgi:hypothetical protein